MKPTGPWQLAYLCSFSPKPSDHAIASPYIHPRLLFSNCLSLCKTRLFTSSRAALDNGAKSPSAHKIRYWSDPAYRQQHRERGRAQYIPVSNRIPQMSPFDDPGFREQCRQKKLAYSRSACPRFSSRVMSLGRKVARRLHSRKVVEWDAHAPDYSTTKVMRQCASCGLERPRNLWWKRKDDQRLFDCHQCFIKDWSWTVPIGYDPKSFLPSLQEVTTTAKPQFDESKTHDHSSEHQTCGQARVPAFAQGGHFPNHERTSASNRRSDALKRSVTHSVPGNMRSFATSYSQYRHEPDMNRIDPARKEAIRAYQRQYYLRNREVLIKNSRQYAARNRERLRDKSRAYYIKNQEQLREKARQKRLSDTEHYRQALEKSSTYLRTNEEAHKRHAVYSLGQYTAGVDRNLQVAEWKTHIPIKTKKKVNFVCSTCQRSKSAILTWQQKVDPKKLDCHRCFADDPERRWPIGHTSEVKRYQRRRKTVELATPASNGARSSTTNKQITSSSSPSDKRPFSTTGKFYQARAYRKPNPFPAGSPEAAEIEAVREQARRRMREHRARMLTQDAMNYLEERQLDNRRYYQLNRARELSKKGATMTRRRAEDPDYVREQKNKEREKYHRSMQRRNSVRVRRLAERALEWPHHTPELSETTTTRCCSTCNRTRDLKLWWKRKESVDFDGRGGYDCHACLSMKPSHMWPIGYPKKEKGVVEAAASQEGDGRDTV